MRPGEVGNIFVQRNPCSASGYYKNPALNEDLWGSGLFDLCETGRFDEEGYLILASRKRNVIKRGGQRISPKDVEDLVMRHPDVREVAAIGMPDPEMGQRICVYIVPKPNCTISLQDLAGFLRAQKASPFLIPERVELISGMPLLLTGHKVDRRWLEQKIASTLEQEARAEAV